jgi:ribosome-associated translation inhibitor RaiA
MTRIVFRNLQASSLTRDIIVERLTPVLAKFDVPFDRACHVTCEMRNGPALPGPDEFRLTLHIVSGPYRGIRLEAASPNLYVALADVAERLLVALNRHSDRVRVVRRRHARASRAAAWAWEVGETDSHAVARKSA